MAKGGWRAGAGRPTQRHKVTDCRAIDVRLRRWLSAFDMTWGREGWFRRLVPGYLAYYKPSFHPWERDTTSLLRKVREELGFDPEGKETIAAVAA